MTSPALRSTTVSPISTPFGLDDVLVVQGRLAHDAARDARRLHDGERRRAAGASDRDDDVEQLRVDLLGRVLVGDRPARCAAGRAELVVQRELVDLDDDAVDLVLDVVAVLAVVPDERRRRRRRGVGDRKYALVGSPHDASSA